MTYGHELRNEQHYHGHVLGMGWLSGMEVKMTYGHELREEQLYHAHALVMG